LQHTYIFCVLASTAPAARVRGDLLVRTRASFFDYKQAQDKEYSSNLYFILKKKKLTKLIAISSI
jgi:hypothetical protein